MPTIIRTVRYPVQAQTVIRQSGSNIMKLDEDMSLSECICTTWISCMQMTVIRIWLSTAQPQNIHTHISTTQELCRANCWARVGSWVVNSQLEPTGGNWPHMYFSLQPWQERSMVWSLCLTSLWMQVVERNHGYTINSNPTTTTEAKPQHTATAVVIR